MSDQKFGYAGLTMEKFITQILPQESDNDRLALTRNLKRALFNGLFKPYRTKVQRTYRTLGHVGQTLFPGSKTKAFVMKELKKQPLTGTLLARKEIYDNHEFIVITHAQEIYILLDNSALDSGLPQVLRWDTAEDLFIEANVDILTLMLQIKS